MKFIQKFYKDERGSGSVAVQTIALFTLLSVFLFILIDFYYLSTVYSYVKDQQDLANRAVYSAIDMNELADRKLHIDESVGLQKFKEYLEKNLMLDSDYNPARPIRIIGNVVIKDFQIYNEDELPTVDPQGKTINEVTVYSEIEVVVKPFLWGKFGTITINPRLTTDVPGFLVKTFHP